MEESRSTKHLLSVIRDRSRGRRMTIGIDGFSQSGKTNLAETLAVDLNGVHVALDSFADPQMVEQSYIGRLRLSDLRLTLDRHVADQATVVVEGICLRQVLESIGVSADLFIYVKRVSSAGIWHDGIDLEEFAAGTIDEMDWLSNDAYAYHDQRSPHKQADVTFLRREDDELADDDD